MPHARNQLKCLILPELLFHLSQCPLACSLAGRVFDFHILCCIPSFSREHEAWLHVISKHFEGIKFCIDQWAAPFRKHSLQVQNTAILEVAVTLSGLIAIVWVKLLAPQTL